MSTSSEKEAAGFVTLTTFIGSGLGSAFLTGGLVGRFGGNVGECLGSAILVGLFTAMFAGWLVGSALNSPDKRDEG